MIWRKKTLVSDESIHRLNGIFKFIQGMYGRAGGSPPLSFRFLIAFRMTVLKLPRRHK